MERIKGLKIRPMTENDWASIIKVDKSITGRDRTLSWPQKASSHLRTYHPSLSFVAEVEGNVVGFIMAAIRGAEYALPLAGWIDSVGVDPEYHRKGIGRKLIETCIEECHLNGIKARLMIRKSDELLKKYLCSIGFKQGELVEFVKGFSKK